MMGSVMEVEKRGNNALHRKCRTEDNERHLR